MRTGSHQLANYRWGVSNDGKTAVSVDHAILAALMDIREELRAITSRLDCGETLSIPRTLVRMAQNTAKPVKRKLRSVKRRAA